jgi:hypothetical protein
MENVQSQGTKAAGIHHTILPCGGFLVKTTGYLSFVYYSFGD